MKKTVIAVSDLGKKYVVYDQPRDRLWGLLGVSQKAKNHWALRNVSFSLQTGQCLGLVGNNGAGKSTLLKLLTGTVQPTTGSVHIDGRLTAILELGAGFHPEFSGRDNLFFGGSLIGLDEKTIKNLLPSIVAFAELEHALDRPVKTYSSGMVVRLAFALITAVEPQVLIIDEALAVGDQNFQKKCVERIEAFKKNGCTILFCSHSLYHVKQLCDVALWMDQGEAKAFGPTEEVLSAYERFLRSGQDSNNDNAVPITPDLASHTATPQTSTVIKTDPQVVLAKIESVQINSQDDSEVPLLQSSDLVVDVVAQAPSTEQPHFAVMLEQASGSGITTVATHTDGVVVQQGDDGAWCVRVVFNDIPLFSGDYVISVYLFDATGLVVLDEWLKCKYFKIIYPSVIPGLVRLPHQWF